MDEVSTSVVGDCRFQACSYIFVPDICDTKKIMKFRISFDSAQSLLCTAVIQPPHLRVCKYSGQAEGETKLGEGLYPSMYVAPVRPTSKFVNTV
jgi:hypothetical protein